MADMTDSTTGSSQKIFETWDDDSVTLNRNLLRGIYAYGFENPSPIQKKSIIPMTNGGDLIAQAQSGTGKTGAFTVGTLQSIDPKVKATQAIIISPTRELVIQNYNVCVSLSHFMKVKTQLLIGGTSTDKDKEELSSDVPHVIVATPGRLYDMLRRNHIKNDNIKVLVLDEADEMLSSGFKEQVYNIFQVMPSTVQVCLFSATMPPEVHALTDKFMRDPTKILVESADLTLQGIKQYKIFVENDQQKYLTITDIFKSISITQCIIYCNSVRRVQDLKDAMVQDGFPVICIHSGMSDEERKSSFKDFKSGKSRILISSDITARGIDVQQVSVVINFDICSNKHTYLHRIGRGGRWGRKGVAINFVGRRDIKKINEIEEWYATQIGELPDNFADEIRSIV
jgi:translation initiation factor 4A